MNYRVDIPNLFERFGKQLSIYSGNTVYYRIVSPDSVLPLLQNEYKLESFTVIGYITYDKKDYAAVLYKSAPDFNKINRIGYIAADEFVNGDIFTSSGQAHIAIQSKIEKNHAELDSACKIPIDVED